MMKDKEKGGKGGKERREGMGGNSLR